MALHIPGGQQTESKIVNCASRMFGATGPLRVVPEATVPKSPDGIFKVVGAFVQGFQRVRVISRDPAHLSG